MAEASTAELVSFSQQGTVGVITINNPPVNALSPGVPEGILKYVQQSATDASIKALVLIGGGRTFIAGADIREFSKMTSGTRERLSLNPLLAKLEDSPKPIVAAIHGTAFGGGLEFAMACQYRVAIASAQVGQPEVKLGLIPGAGGTQRLPRVAGVPTALQMCAGGDPIGAKDALAAGVVDRVVDGTTGDDLLAGAVKFAAELTGPHKRTRDKSAKLGDSAANAAAIAAARGALKKKGRVLIAPAAAIDAIEATTLKPFDEGLAVEAELFQKCLFSDQSRSLIHAFFGERAVSKIPGIGKDVPLIPIKRAAVVGAGTMGGGIAMNYVTPVRPALRYDR